MKVLAWLTVACAALGTLTGCVESLNDTHYVVKCTIDKSLGTDSVSLLILDEAYNRVLKVSTVPRDSAMGAFVFEGQIEHPSVAYFKFSNDSTPFFFVLEHGESLVEIGSRGVIVTAGDYNHQYFSYLKDRKALIEARLLIRNQYLGIISADSVVNIDKERHLLVQDSLMGDSLDKLTVEAINGGGPVARIVFNRFVNSLSPSSLSKINK